MNQTEREELLDKIATVAGEHAKAFVFIMITEDETGTDRISSEWNAQGCGGRPTAHGLLRHLITQIETDIAREHQTP